jgi:hypothetical protein
MENGEYNPYETSKIIYEDDKVKFIEVFDSMAAKYFGGWEYDTNWNDKYREGDLYFIIDGVGDGDYSMHNVDGKTEFRQISSNVTFTDPTDIYKEFPTIKGVISEKVFGSDVYKLLVKIKNGYDPGWVSLGKYDNLLYDIIFNEKSPGLSKITIQFDSDEDYLGLFEDLDNQDIYSIIDLLGSGQYDSNRYETSREWDEGGIYDYYLDVENKEKVDLILSLMIKDQSGLSNEQRMSVFSNHFGDVADRITEEWGSIESECVREQLKDELYEEFGNKFFTVGIIEKNPLRRYETTVNILLKLFTVIGNKTQTLEELLKVIIRKFDNASHGWYDEMYWNTNCPDYDMVSFNKEAKWYLDRLYGSIVDSNEYKDIYEFIEIKNRVESEYGFDRWNKTKINPDLNFRIDNIDKRTNNLIVVVKVGDNRSEKRTMSYDDLKRLESQYELFENKKIFNESVDPKFKSVLKWLNKEFGDLTEVVKGTKTYYVDKKGLPLTYYLKKNKRINPIIFINYDRIWSLIGNIFGLDDSQTREILTIWLDETYNLKGYRVYTDWNEIVNWKIPLLRK